MSQSSAPENPSAPSEAPRSVKCPPATDPLIRFFAMAALFGGMGIYCLLDPSPKPEAWDLEHVNEVASYVLNFGPVVFFPVALVMTALAVRHSKRTLAADSTGIGYEKGEKIPWEKVAELDVSQAGKGIVVLHADSGRKLKLDSWKL
jgi:hypothetical protein